MSVSSCSARILRPFMRYVDARRLHRECWFPYATPPDLGEHQRSFVNATLKFNAPFFAFVFNRAY